MIKSIEILLDELKLYQNPMVKISNMVKKRQLFPIVRGLYETDSSIPGHYLASLIYGPSYLSFEFALSFHGLIPEAVYHFTSATYNKRRRKIYDNHYGRYTYRDVPKLVFPLANVLYQENGYSFVIAKPEKAICDMLYTFEPCSNQKELKSLLFDFLRIDEESFIHLNFDLLIELAQYYKVKNCQLLIKLLYKEIKKSGHHPKPND
jgi:predicted transcriptional regulator of viral defense system